MSPEKESVHVDRELNLRGEVCPYTFVKSKQSKLALEKMEGDQILKITVDNSESASNVPRSLELEGHAVLEVDREEKSVWNIIVKKISSGA
jgi:TusA-related sulfurtransferase